MGKTMKFIAILMLVLLSACATPNRYACGPGHDGSWEPTSLTAEGEARLIKLMREGDEHFDVAADRFWYKGTGDQLLACSPLAVIPRGYYRGSLSSCFTKQYVFGITESEEYTLSQHFELVCTG